MNIINRTSSLRDRAVMMAAVMGLLVVTAWGQELKERAVAIKGAAIETISGARIEKGNIIIRAGKIEAAGAAVAIPDDARVIDAEGMTVMPGVIDPFSQAGGLTGGGDFVKVSDQFYPYQDVFKQMLPYGITNLSITPSSLGQTAAIAVTPDQPKTMLINKDGNLFLPLANSTSSLQVLRDGLALQPTAPQRQGPEIATRAGRGRGQRGGNQQQQQRGAPRAGQRAAGGPSSMADPLWEKVVKGEQYLIIDVANSATILYLGEILEKYPEVKVALNTTGSIVFETIETLKKFKPLLILPPRIEYQPNRQYRINAARIAHEAGLEVAFTGLKPEAGGAVMAGARAGRGQRAGAAPTRGVSEANRDMPLFPVAYLVKSNMPRKIALEALTLNPARAMGLEDRLGTIEPQKDANLLIFSGDPLDPASRLLRVMVEGKFVYENKN